LKKSSDKFIDKYQSTRDKKDYKKALNTTKVYYAITKNDDYKNKITELKNLGKGGENSKIFIQLLAKKPLNDSFENYVKEYNNKISLLTPDIKEKTLSYGNNKIENYIKKLKFIKNEVENYEKISYKIQNSDVEINYKIAIKIKEIDTKETKIEELKNTIISLINEYNQKAEDKYNNFFNEFNFYDFKNYSSFSDYYIKNNNQFSNYDFLKLEYSFKNYDETIANYKKNVPFIFGIIESDKLRLKKLYYESFNLLYKNDSDENLLLDTRRKVSKNIINDIKINIINVDEPLDLFNKLLKLKRSKGYYHHKEFFDENIGSTTLILKNNIISDIDNQNYEESLKGINALSEVDELKDLSNELSLKYYSSYNPFIILKTNNLIENKEFERALKIISDLGTVEQTKQTSKKLKENYYKHYNKFIYNEVYTLINNKEFKVSIEKINQLNSVDETKQTSQKLLVHFDKEFDNSFNKRLNDLKLLIKNKKINEAKILLKELDTMLAKNENSIKETNKNEYLENKNILEQEKILEELYFSYMTVKLCYEKRKNYLIQIIQRDDYNNLKSMVKKIESKILDYDIFNEKQNWEKAENRFKNEFGDLIDLPWKTPGESTQFLCLMYQNDIINKAKQMGIEKNIKKDF